MIERISLETLRVPVLALSLGVTSACLAGTAPPLPEPGGKTLPAANVSARENIVISQLKTIKRSEDVYLADKGKYASMQELVSAGTLNQSPQGLGYTIDLTVGEGGSKFVVMAVPTEYGPNGKRSFYMDDSGLIRGADHQGGAPAATDPPVD